MRGRFLAFEGIDGSGKSSQRILVAERLRAAGIDVIETREPGGTPLAERFRELMLSMHSEPVSPKTEMLSMFASREQHLEVLIRPALAAGKWVLTDRFVASSYAYQVHGRGMPESLFNSLCEHIVGDTMPDITFVFDMPDEVARARLLARSGKNDRLDNEAAAFYQRANNALRELASRPGYQRINADQPIEAVTDEIVSYLLDSYPLT